MPRRKPTDRKPARFTVPKIPTGLCEVPGCEGKGTHWVPECQMMVCGHHMGYFYWLQAQRRKGR